MTDVRTTGEARRVVLLARPGGARDRMREALDQAGANVVLEADPAATDEAAVLAARPEVALVVLDATTDEALDRFPSLLSDSSVDVLFEEAELAVGRVGWDAARWVRHLGAKLRRSGDVLPPGGDQTAAVARTGTEAASAPPASELPPELPPELPSELPPALDAGPELEPPPLPPLPEVPGLPDLPDHGAAARENEAASPGAKAGVPTSDFDLVLPELETDVAPAPVAASEPAASASPFAHLSLEPLDEPSATDVRIEGLERADDSATASHGAGLTIESLAIEGLAIEGLAIEGLAIEGLERFDEGAPTEIRIEGLERPGDDAPSEILIEGLERAEVPSSSGISFEGLTLEGWDDDGNAQAGDPQAASTPAWSEPARDAAPPAAPASAHGAVLVLAGIGGPDAVRQLLGALPDDFPRPVLVQQRLDGGHYDKLVMQMQRATRLPVRLAAAGDAAQSGAVYVLPPSVGIEDTAGGLAFNADGADLFAALPAGDSAVLMLSGADPARVDEAVVLAANGAFVAGQSLDGCYDVAAPAALASRGVASGSPAELARQLAERWS